MYTRLINIPVSEPEYKINHSTLSNKLNVVVKELDKEYSAIIKKDCIHIVIRISNIEDQELIRIN